MSKGPYIVVIVNDDHVLTVLLDNPIRSVGYRTKGFSSAGIQIVICPEYMRSWIASDRDWQQKQDPQ